MKKIGLITSNKVLAQSLASTLGNNPDLKMEAFLLLDPNQMILDAELAGIDIALIDVIDAGLGEAEAALAICERLRERLPHCSLLLLMSQDNKEGRDMAIGAVRNKIVDDFVFCSTSLEYLFAKLEAF